MDVTIHPAGDCALVVSFEQVIDPAVNDRVHMLAAALKAANLPGLQECLPTFCSLMVCYDPMQLSYVQLREHCLHCLNSESTGHTEAQLVHLIPCCYGGILGPDLSDLATYTGLTPDEVISLHSGSDYKIYMLGFLPGFVYLGGLDTRLQMPRLTSPRTRIEPGSVGIGGAQTGIYPLASPGGWRLLGRTPVKLYDPNRTQPILCNAGEWIRFVPISPADYTALQSDVANGTYHHQTTRRELS